MEALEFDTIGYEETETDVTYRECPVCHHSLLQEFVESYFCHVCETIIDTEAKLRFANTCEQILR